MFQVHHRSDVQGFPQLNTRNFFRLRMIHIQKGSSRPSQNNINGQICPCKAFKSLRAKQKVICRYIVGSNSAGSTILKPTFFFRFLHPGATQHDLTTIIYVCRNCRSNKHFGLGRYVVIHTYDTLYL